MRKGGLVGGAGDFQASDSKAKAHKVEFGSAEHVVSVLIAEIINFFYMEDIAEILDIKIEFSNLSEFLDLKVDLFKKGFDAGIISLDTAAKGFAAEISGWVSTFGGVLDNYFSKEVATALFALPYFTDLLNDYSGRYLSPMGAFIMMSFDMLIGIIVDGAGEFLSKLVSPIVGNLFTVSADWLYNIESTRYKAEYIAYNWYYLFFI